MKKQRTDFLIWWLSEDRMEGVSKHERMKCQASSRITSYSF
jgi:hypothetical protein